MNSMKSQNCRPFNSIVIESTRIPQNFWALERLSIDTFIIIYCLYKKKKPSRTKARRRQPLRTKTLPTKKFSIKYFKLRPIHKQSRQIVLVKYSPPPS